MDQQLDYLNKNGAIQLARQIRDYWAKRGIAIETFIKSETLAGQQIPIFSVRSNVPGVLKERQQ